MLDVPRGTIVRLALLLLLPLLKLAYMPVQAQTTAAAVIYGTVVTEAGQPADHALVALQCSGSAQPIETQTDAAGSFSFSPPEASSYQVSAVKSGLHGGPITMDRSAVRKGVPVRLTLGAPPAGDAMDFADQPSFKVAGVTDWTAVGGHGSDSILRTSEDLAREAARLKAQDAARRESAPQAADQHSKAAALDEQSGNPLAAVHEYQEAVRLDPSEPNYFAWGSELLIHRAVWQAIEVFRTGNKLHPGSMRMLLALGAAQFAGDLYEEAAASLCAASDLQPSELAPYTFMGRVSIAALGPLPCIEQRLARFVQMQPQNAQAHYLYAMALSKIKPDAFPTQQTSHIQSLLSQAVAIDPGYADAWLQLGILAEGQHRPEEAMRDYSRAVAADPQSGEAHFRLGVAYDRSGAAEKARQEFKLHDELKKSQAAAVERERKEIKQFLVVLESQPAPAAAHE